MRLATAALVGGAAVAGVPAPPSPPPPAVEVEPLTGMRLRRIPAGEFEMGSPQGEPMREEQEQRHRVRLSSPFYLGETEVTQEQWEKALGPGERPSLARECGPRCPVENVSFFEVEEFLRKLNAGAEGPPFRLPTEAEWEYACRAGTTTPFSAGTRLTTEQANFDGRRPYGGGKAGASRSGPTPVRTFPPNAWGLFDMHGNVWEWTADWHCPYENGPLTDPIGRCSSGQRVIRGGSWLFGADSARCALRYTHAPGDRGPSLGFRVARDVP